MIKKNIFIIGAGFSGIYAAKKLKCQLKNIANIFLIDSQKKSVFLPLLPDILGRGIDSENLLFDLEKFCRKNKINFLNEEILSVDLEQSKIVSNKSEYKYDFLIIASGSQTNFYGNKQIEQISCKIDNVLDVEKIKKLSLSNMYDNFVISGAGYTGIEVATNLRVLLKKNNFNKDIFLVERAPSILGPLPQWMKDYVLFNLKRLGINVLLNTSIEQINGKMINISNGKILDNSLLIWAAGVRTADYIQKMSIKKNPQGRILVDDFLSVNSNCFVVGDAACFPFEGNFLRMGVQFSIAQGIHAAENLIKIIYKKPLAKFFPVDLGYIIPMANNKACGLVLSKKVQGIKAIVFHYLICIYRTFGMKNKIRLFFNLLKGG